MPTSKRVSTRRHSITHYSQGGRDSLTKVTTRSAVGECLSTRGWSVESLLELGKGNFEEVERISVQKMTPQRIVDTIRRYEEMGCPLILEEWHLRKEWNKGILSVDYLVKHLPDEELPTRNIYDRSDKTTTLKEYVDYSRALPLFASEGEAERYYGKDAPVPPAWAKWLAGAIPEQMQALGSGDVMRYLKASDQPETLMCYFGVGDTYTPAHKDLCASVGHNLLTYSENDGSAFWFMSSTSDADAASTWFHGMNEELDLETHLATVEQWAQGPFKVYICQQRLGDFVLVPKRSCHQVINHGGLNIKTSWSRMSIESLELSLDIELSIYRRVCRAEVHRVRLNVWEALRTCTKLIESSSVEELQKEPELLRRLVPLFSKILAEEFDPDLGSHERILRKGESIHVVCNCCGGDIFQSFFRCLHCTPPTTANPRVGLALCSGCYCEGRTCLCGPEAKMQPCQMRDVKLLLADRSAAAQVLRKIAGEGAPKRSKADISDGSDLHELKHAPLFRLANHLLRLRNQMPKKPRKCNMYRRSGVQHKVAFDNARTCGQCHSALCYEHILESFGIHCMELWWQDITANSKSLKSTQWHKKHIAQTGSVGKASFNSVKPGTEARIGWAQYFARFAWKYQHCHPVSDHVRVGWYDPRTLNASKPKHVNTRDPEFSPSAEKKPRRSAASPLATPSRVQAKRKATKGVAYVDESSDEIAASVSEVSLLDKNKGKKRRYTDSEDIGDPVTESAAPKRRKVETRKGVYKLHIPVHVHVPRRRPTPPTQHDAISSDAMDVLWNDDAQGGTITEASEEQTLPPLPAPKSKQRPRRSVTKTILNIPVASSSSARTRTRRSKAVPGSLVQGPPTPPSDTSPASIPMSISLPASIKGIPPFNLAAFKSEIRAEVTTAVAAQITSIQEEILAMRAGIERFGQNGSEARLAEIEVREATLTAKEEEYERLKAKEIELTEGLAALGTRYREMEQELEERFAIKERDLLEKASRTPPQIEQSVQDISVDQGAEEMELLVQEVSTEESTNYNVSIQQGEPFGVVSQVGCIVPFTVLEAAESEEVAFQEALVITAEVETVEDWLPTNKMHQILDSGGDGHDGRQISATVPMVKRGAQDNPGPEMIPSAYGFVKTTEELATLDSLMDGLTVMGCTINPQISRPASPADLDEDAEADIDAEADENSAPARPTNDEQ